MPRRPILLALLVAGLTTGAILVVVAVRASSPSLSVRDARRGRDPGPADRRARPSTAPRSTSRRSPASRSSSTSGARAASRAATSSRCSSRSWPSTPPTGSTVVGVLTDDPVEPARDFVDAVRRDWPTVVDPDKAIKAAYRVAGRPQTYFVDRTGVIRSIQVGELTDADFERQYARIAP